MNEAGIETGRRLAWRDLVPGFWLLIFVLLWFLGINKQLDLQTLLTDVGRNAARSQGWFDFRRPVQKTFVIVLALIGGATLIGSIWWVRRSPWRYGWALAGLATLAGYAMLRAALFHHASPRLPLLHPESGHHALHDVVMELAGNLMLCIGAWRAITHAQRVPGPAV